MPALAIPEYLQNRFQALLGPEAEAFWAALQQPPPVSIHINWMKWGAPWPFGENYLPWYPAAGYLPQRPNFTLDPFFHAGAYYVQEASSTLVYLALSCYEHQSSYVPHLMLDLCAAPGGKSALLASRTEFAGLLVANEVVPNRRAVLRENLAKWGMPGTVITGLEAHQFAPLAGCFDVVLVDAPCSGQGLFRRQPAYLHEFRPEMVPACATRQQDILAHAAPLVKPGGLLVYSTCTYEEAENEAQIRTLLRNQPGQWLPLRLDVLPEWGIEVTEPLPNYPAYRCWPHRMRGEGFFLCALMKVGDPFEEAQWPQGKPIQPIKIPDALVKTHLYAKNWVGWQLGKDVASATVFPSDYTPYVPALVQHLRPERLGIPLGEPKGKDWQPSAEMALSYLTSDFWQGNKLLLNNAQALQYYKGESLPIEAARGLTLLQYQANEVSTLNLGWANSLGNRLNNHWPKAWRIRMDLPAHPTETD